MSPREPHDARLRRPFARWAASGAVASLVNALLIAAMVFAPDREARPPPEDGPPAFAVEIVPPVPPKARPAPTPPRPRRTQRLAVLVAPPEAPGPREGPAAPEFAHHPAPLPPTPMPAEIAALRHSPVGCGNAEAVRLLAVEQDYCDDMFGLWGQRRLTPPAL